MPSIWLGFCNPWLSSSTFSWILAFSARAKELHNFGPKLCSSSGAPGTHLWTTLAKHLPPGGRFRVTFGSLWPIQCEQGSYITLGESYVAHRVHLGNIFGPLRLGICRLGITFGRPWPIQCEQGSYITLGESYVAHLAQQGGHLCTVFARHLPPRGMVPGHFWKALALPV